MIFAFPAYATETITVAVASSLYPAMQQQAVAFEKNHDVTVRLISGSTGRLYNQIIQGAPFDVFIAADEQRPAMLAKLGRVLERQQVGQGYLGLMIGHRVVGDPAELTDASIRHIAIANPDVAPFGQATKKMLQGQGFWLKLKHKFVYAQNAMQAKMMVDKGLVDAGFVPVASNNVFLATLPYVGVLLTDKKQSYAFLRMLEHKASGGAASAAQEATVPVVLNDRLKP